MRSGMRIRTCEERIESGANGGDRDEMREEVGRVRCGIGGSRKEGGGRQRGRGGKQRLKPCRNKKRWKE